MNEPSSLTQLIHRAQAGDDGAANALFAETYADLSRLARARLRPVGRHTFLETGALVHESYLRFTNARRRGSRTACTSCDGPAR